MRTTIKEHGAHGHSPDKAADIVLHARHNSAPARQWIKVLARADAAGDRYQQAVGLAFPLVDWQSEWTGSQDGPFGPMATTISAPETMGPARAKSRFDNLKADGRGDGERRVAVHVPQLDAL